MINNGEVIMGTPKTIERKKEELIKAVEENKQKEKNAKS